MSTLSVLSMYIVLHDLPLKAHGPLLVSAPYNHPPTGSNWGYVPPDRVLPPLEITYLPVLWHKCLKHAHFR